MNHFMAELSVTEDLDKSLGLLRILNYLEQDFDGYPYDFEKDRKYFARLICEFPNIDIEEELKQYHAWILDQPSWKKISYRSRFRQWLKRSLQFRMGHLRLY